jgi:hypothetical protein
MNWTLDQIVDAITKSDSQELNSNGFALPLWDSNSNVGVGHDVSGEQILVFPGDAELIGFEKKFATFAPWSRLIWEQGNTELPHVSILRCKFDISEELSIRAVAGVFKGLLDIDARFHTAGRAVNSLRKLFEEGLAEYSPQGVTGLIGELLVIMRAPDKVKAVEAWHSHIDAAFDFSWNSNRLEVKATKTSERVHNFSSNQVPGPDGISLQVASVKIHTTEIGQTLGDLVEYVISDLPEDLATKVTEICTETVKVPIFSVLEPVFDYPVSLETVQFYRGSEVPAPEMVADVRSMKWEASLENTTPVEPIFPDGQDS